MQERGFLWPPVGLAPQPLFYPVAHSVSPSPALHALDDAPVGGEGREEKGRMRKAKVEGRRKG